MNSKIMFRAHSQYFASLCSFSLHSRQNEDTKNLDRRIGIFGSSEKIYKGLLQNRLVVAFTDSRMANNRPVLEFETEMAMLSLDGSIDLYFSSCAYSTGYKHKFGNALPVRLGTNPFIVLFSHPIKNL